MECVIGGRRMVVHVRECVLVLCVIAVVLEGQ